VGDKTSPARIRADEMCSALIEPSFPLSPCHDLIGELHFSLAVDHLDREPVRLIRTLLPAVREGEDTLAVGAQMDDAEVRAVKHEEGVRIALVELADKELSHLLSSEGFFLVFLEEVLQRLALVAVVAFVEERRELRAEDNARLPLTKPSSVPSK
jgi:hypothetical protein